MVKTQSAKTGIQKPLVSARMVTSPFRETLPTVKVSKLFNEVTVRALFLVAVVGD